jgi:hypothetical protein
MDTGKKAAIGGTLLLIAVVSIRVGMIYHERNAVENPVTTVTAPSDPDDLVFLRKLRPSSLADAKDLAGKTVWVSAGGQLNFYPYANHKADYAKPVGTLLGAEPLAITDAIEQVAPKTAAVTYRIPGGDKQVLLVFTRPKSADPTKLYAAPVGYRKGTDYTFYTDEVLFYDDPHTLYGHWSPQVWQAVDEHRVILGMNERQVELALGQVSKSLSNDYGNRLVIFANLGKPKAVTFVKNQVTAVRDDQGF